MARKSKKTTSSKKQDLTTKPLPEVKEEIVQSAPAPREIVHRIKKVKVDRYKDVSPINFAGPMGGASPYSFKVDTIKRARTALALAHFAPNEEGIRRAILKRWPELDKKKGK